MELVALTAVAGFAVVAGIRAISTAVPGMAARPHWVVMVAAGWVAVLAGIGGANAVTVVADAGTVRAAGSWHKAIEMPGTRDLNGGRSAEVGPVSCPSPGTCAAGGTYQYGSGHSEGFVVSQRHGAWGKALEVPGLRALNAGKSASVNSLSCASPGNWTAAGIYTDRFGHSQGFVVSEQRGSWGTAIEVLGLRALNTGGSALGLSVSCGSPGNCVIGGQYQDAIDLGHAFVASERDGTWGKAIEVPGLGVLNSGGIADVVTVSCASAGNCAAGGTYLHHGVQGFVVSYCAAGGLYTDRTNHVHGFVVTERQIP